MAQNNKDALNKSEPLKINRNQKSSLTNTLTIPLAGKYIEDIASCDINNDGKDELIILTNYDYYIGSPQIGQVLIYKLINNSFQLYWQSQEIEGYPTQIQVSDINNDNYQDILISAFGGVRLFINNSGSYSYYGILVNPSGPDDFIVCDLDNDNLKDLAIGSIFKYSGYSIQLYKENSLNSFISKGELDGTEGSNMVRKIEFDNDNMNDLLGGELYSGDIYVFKNDQAFNFTKTFNYEFNTRIFSLETADFDNDQREDFIVAEAWKKIHFFKKMQNTYEIKYQGTDNVGSAFSTKAIDVNNDNLMDLIVAAFDGSLYIYKNKGGFQFDEILAADAYSNEGNYGLALGDFDNDGNYDIAYGADPVYISFNVLEVFGLSQNATFSANLTATYNYTTLSNADIYVNRRDGQGFQYAGKTGNNGEPVMVTNLKVGDSIRASKLMHTEPSVKDGHGEVDNTMFELWVDSDFIYGDGSYIPFAISSQKTSYTINCKHSIYKYNLVLSAEWEMNDDYYNKLDIGLKEASKLLYNATDGQALFNKIAIYDQKFNKTSADIILHESVDGNYCDEIGGIDKKWELWQILASQLHMHRLQIYQYHYPNQSDWYHSLIHEFGHYGFGLYDEYLNGLGINWEKYSLYEWNAGGNEHPFNYGIMQDHQYVSEVSSQNDYLLSYPIIYEKPKVTEQLDERKMSCWDWIDNKWQEYYSNQAIILPPYGWYPDNPPYNYGCAFRFDREGPNDPSIIDKTSIIDLRTGKDKIDGKNNNFIQVKKNDESLPAAQIIKIIGNKKTVLGKSNIDGIFDMSSTYFGDNFLVSKVSNGNFISKQIQINNSGKIEIVDLCDNTISKKNDKNYTTDPGVVIDVSPILDSDALTLSFDLYFDEVLTVNPKAILKYADVTDSITFTQAGSSNKFEGSSLLNLLNSDFDGTGYLEITLQQDTNSPISFLSEFSLFPLDTAELNMIFNKGFNLNIDNSIISTPELGISLATYYIPYGTQAQQLYPVTDMFTVKSETTNTFSDPAGLNIYYTDAEAVGYDESSLGLYKWNPAGSIWEIVDGYGLGTKDNVLSSLISSSGIYCVFANILCSDSIAPGSINDLNANPGDGQSMVNLSWTSSGDDSNIGQATDYLIRFSEDSITFQNWDQSKIIGTYIKPAPAGTLQTLSVKMPNQNHLYYIAIRAIDECGNLSEISNLAYTASSLLNYSFSLLSPGHNEKLYTFEPTFTWEKPQVNDSLTYVLVFSENQSFDNSTIISGIDTTAYKLTNGLDNSKTYYWKVIALYSYGDTITANQPYYKFSTSSTFIGKHEQNPSNNLYCYPNPFTDIVNIGYTIENVSQVNLTVYNLQGKPIITLVNATQPKGEYKFQWSPEVPSGIYYCTLRTKDATATRKIVLIR